MLRARCGQACDLESFYATCASLGYGYGEAFQGLRSGYAGEGEALVEVRLPDALEQAEIYGVHPALLDAAFQATLLLAQESTDGSGLRLPFAMERVRVYVAGARAAMAYVRRSRGKAGGEGSVDVTLADMQGQVL